MLKLKTPVLWPPDAKNWFLLFIYLFIYLFILNWFLLKDPDAGKDWRQEKGTTEDEMVGWHHRLYEHEFEKAPGVGDGQGILACCSLWSRKKSDTTEWLNWTEPFSSSKWSVIVSLSQYHRKNYKSKLMYFPCHFIATDRKKWKQWQILFSWAPKSLWITMDFWSHEIKRHLLLGRKAVTKLDIILKSKTSLCW